MEYYGLTKLGAKLARTTGHTSSPEWGVINYLRGKGRASKEQIEANCIVPYGDVAGVLRKLKARGIISEELV